MTKILQMQKEKTCRYNVRVEALPWPARQAIYSGQWVAMPLLCSSPGLPRAREPTLRCLGPVARLPPSTKACSSRARRTWFAQVEGWPAHAHACASPRREGGVGPCSRNNGRRAAGVLEFFILRFASIVQVRPSGFLLFPGCGVCGWVCWGGGGAES
jgi:hypothetical protein